MKRAAEEEILTLQDGQCIMQVGSLRGSNLIEVIDQQGDKSLALFPAKFQKSMWIKRGSFVVVDQSGKEDAVKSGSKVAYIVCQVLYYEQVRALQKSPEWPAVFKSSNSLDANRSPQGCTSHQEDDNEDYSSDDEDLPPLEANMNRIKPFELQSEEDSDSGSDTDP